MTNHSFTERNNSVDVLRFICAFLVVTIHCEFWNKLWIMPFSRCAVSLFFMMSGYFIFNADANKMRTRLTKGIRKILKISGWCFLFYIVCFYIPFKVLLGTAKWDYNIIWKVLIFNVDPVCFHMWYLLAMLYTLALAWLITRWGKWQHLILFVIIAILIRGVVNYISVAVSGEFVPPYFFRNFLFLGLPYFCLGGFIKQHREKIAQHSTAHYILLALISLLLCYVENAWCLSQGLIPEIYLFTAPLCYAILVLALKIPTAESRISFMGKEYMLLVYLLHPYFVYLIKFCFHNHPFPGYYYCSPIVVFIITLIAVGILKFPWTKF